MYCPSVIEIMTPWDTLPLLAFDSDVYPGARASISTVAFPATAFRWTANVQVPNAATMDAKWLEAITEGRPTQGVGLLLGAAPGPPGCAIAFTL
jgi:hypothetical protein